MENCRHTGGIEHLVWTSERLWTLTKIHSNYKSGFKMCIPRAPEGECLFKGFMDAKNAYYISEKNSISFFSPSSLCHRYLYTDFHDFRLCHQVPNFVMVSFLSTCFKSVPSDVFLLNGTPEIEYSYPEPTEFHITFPLYRLSILDT